VAKKLKPVLAGVIIVFIVASFYIALLYLHSDKEDGGRGAVVRIHPGATLHGITSLRAARVLPPFWRGFPEGWWSISVL